MKVEITMSQIWWNPSIWDLIMRGQSQDTLNALVAAVCYNPNDCGILFNAIESYYSDWDSFEESLYEDTVNTILISLGLEEYIESAEDEE